MSLVEEDVRRELEALGAPSREPALSAVALTLAARLDEAATRDSAPIASQLRETLVKIKTSCAEAQPKRGRLDDLAARRAARGADTEDSQRPAQNE